MTVTAVDETAAAGRSVQVGIAPLPDDYLARYLAATVPAAGLADWAAFATDPAWAPARVAATRTEPLLFGLLYMPNHLTDDRAGLSLSPFHVQLADRAKRWLTPGGWRDDRVALVAPRNSGKSTWTFLVLPCWAAAHGHRRFIGAIADSPTQATAHLNTLRLELDRNPRLRNDYPTLCRPALRQRGTTYADRADELQQASGFTMVARGMDSKVLGMKRGESRPDLLIIDDPEPQESTYSPTQVEKRRSALLDTVLPLNDFASVIISGTVTMAGSLMHQMVRPAYGGDPEAWPDEARIDCLYFPAIYRDAAGDERSLWPQRWPLTDLVEIRHTREFAKNFMNRPVSADGDYWKPEDYTYSHPPEGCRACRSGAPGSHQPAFGNTVLSVDPAVSDRTTSDFYGFAVVSRGPDNRARRVWVRECWAKKLDPAAFRTEVLNTLERVGDIGLVLVETNQGGDLWRQLLHDLPVRLRTVHQHEPKTVRAARVLQDYQTRRVAHTVRLPALEEQQMSFPKVLNDDLVDAAGAGCLYFLDDDRARARGKRGTVVGSYV